MRDSDFSETARNVTRAVLWMAVIFTGFVAMLAVVIVGVLKLIGVA